MRRPASGTIAILLGLVAGVAIGPLLLRGDAAEQSRLQENSRRIAEMTDSERSRLQRNEARWQSMSDAERQQWRDFAAKLQLDRRDNQGRLSTTMDSYYRWLGTLYGYQREQLRQAADVQRKLQLTDTIVSDQIATRLDVPEFELQEAILSPEQLEAVMAGIEGVLTSSESQQLYGPDEAPLEGLPRYIKTIDLLRKRFGRSPTLGANSAFRRAIAESLPEEVNDYYADKPPAAKYLTFWASLKAEVDRSQRARSGTDPVKLREFFDTLPPEEQEAMYNLGAQEFVDQLQARYLYQQVGTETDVNVGEIIEFLNPRRVFEDLARERPGEGPGRFRRPDLYRADRGFPGPGGERGPGDFEGGDRPPPQRPPPGRGDGQRPPPGDRERPREGEPPPPRPNDNDERPEPRERPRDEF
ncbi:MAG: hypothetical protein R3B90_05270 [Planctomycetaceae bacterium]